MKERLIDSNPHEAIRRHVEAAQDWEWHGIATELYRWSDRFSDRFFNREMPDIVLGFQRLDVRILAGYTLKRNPQGLLYEITFNARHLERPLWETLETLMHEYVHLWQQNYGQNPVSRNYHNREFVGRCEELGLHPATGSGVHLRPADGAFAEFLKAYGVSEPPPLVEPQLNPKGRPLDWWTKPRERQRGRSTLAKWSCGCQNARVGAKEFHACCLKCGGVFELVDVAPSPEMPRTRKAKEEVPWKQRRLVWPESAPSSVEQEMGQSPEQSLSGTLDEQRPDVITAYGPQTT